MRKKDEKKGLVPLPVKPKHVQGERNDVYASVTALTKFCKDLTIVIQAFNPANREKMNLSTLDEVEQNSEIIKAVEFLIAFINPNLLLLLEKRQNGLSQKLETENKAKSKTPKSVEQIQPLRHEKMVTINSGIMVFAKIFGNIVENLKNKDGNRLIEVDNKTLAKILSLNCKLIDGKPLNSDSLEIYIGQGRKMESIINQDVLKEFFKKNF